MYIRGGFVCILLNHLGKLRSYALRLRCLQFESLMMSYSSGDGVEFIPCDVDVSITFEIATGLKSLFDSAMPY